MRHARYGGPRGAGAVHADESCCCSESVHAGHAVARGLRADPATSHVPILMLTACASDVVAQGIAAGAHDHLKKPFQAEELEARVQTLLARAA